MAYSSPPDPKAYASAVYEIVRVIPPGRVMTYGQIAALIPPPAGVEAGTYFKVSPRWVGGAMAQCPDDVPWQRVINSQGKVSARPGMGAVVQRRLLEQEGVEFDERERVDMARYEWAPQAEWIHQHGLIPPPTDDPGQPRLF